MPRYRIAGIAGDGIGHEVVPEGIRVLDAAAWTIGFSLPGKYLVICNVRGHFVDGMYAWINVVDDDGDN